MQSQVHRPEEFKYFTLIYVLVYVVNHFELYTTFLLERHKLLVLPFGSFQNELFGPSSGKAALLRLTDVDSISRSSLEQREKALYLGGVLSGLTDSLSKALFPTDWLVHAWNRLA